MSHDTLSLMHLLQVRDVIVKTLVIKPNATLAKSLLQSACCR